MAQIGEGHEARGATPQVLTFGSAIIGEILAERYQVEEHVGDDTHGRQLYRGMDVVLRRPVTIVLRHPGGDSASEMLAAAVAASRVVHPHLVGVYDAIDEGERAYVVREWIDGVSLRDALTEGPIDTARALAITRAISEAVTALHETGVVHGNVHPGTVMIAQDGRVMLADSRAGDDATQATDVRALGGVLYSALTGFWPHAEAGPAPLADGVHENGRLVPPRQLRPDIPVDVDELTISLLDPGVEPAPAAAITAELAAMIGPTDEDEDFDNSLDLATFHGSSDAPVAAGAIRRRLMLVIGALVALALVGSLAAMQFGGGSGTDTGTQGNHPTTTSSASHPSASLPHQLTISANQVRICVGTSSGDRKDTSKSTTPLVDGNQGTPWTSQGYGDADMHGVQTGLGFWLDLGAEQRVSTVEVDMARAGATVELRGGTADPGNGRSTNDGDNQILSSYAHLVEPQEASGARVVFTVGNETPLRYLLVWFTKLPPDGTGNYRIGIDEITVKVQ